MSSAAAGDEQSWSAIVADTARGWHFLKIDGYSITNEDEPIISCPFAAGGHRWRIYYYPNGRCPESADYISFLLVLDEHAAGDVTAQCLFSFAGRWVEKRPSLASVPMTNFTGGDIVKGGKNCAGQPKFIKRRYLERMNHLKDDSFTVRCDVLVIKDYRAEDRATILTVSSSDLRRHLSDLLETEKGADVVFDVGPETFAAHRCVLAARSLVFSAELFGPMKEAGTTIGVVRVQDMDAQVFKALLRFAYTESLPETLEEEDIMCQHLLVAADRYSMDRLKLICEEKLCEYINVGTVATVLVLAEAHHCSGLKKACFHFLGSTANLMTIVNTDDFRHLSMSHPSLLMELIAMSTAT